MPKLAISVNGKSINVPYNYVEEIVSSIPDDPIFNDIIDELSNSSDPKVREAIAYRDTLSEKTVNILLRDKQIEVLRSLVRSHDTRKFISENDLSLLIKTEDCYLLESIVDDIDDFLLCPVDAIAGELLKINNSYVNGLMAKSLLVGTHALEALANDTNADIAMHARETLKKIADLNDDE